MGRKRRRTGQYLYLSLAAIVILVWPGCASLPSPQGSQEEPPAQQTRRWEHLQPVQAHIDERDFEGAARQYQAMLSAPGEKKNAPDLVLFDLGLLAAHYANPRKDYKKSIGWFTRLVREYPRSPLVEEAKIWVNILETLERTKLIDIELEEKKKEMSRQAVP